MNQQHSSSLFNIYPITPIRVEILTGIKSYIGLHIHYTTLADNFPATIRGRVARAYLRQHWRQLP